MGNVRVPISESSSPLHESSAYNLVTITTFKGTSKPREYGTHLAVVVNEDHTVKHLIYAFEVSPIKEVTPESYMILLEATGANHPSEAHYNVQVKFGHVDGLKQLQKFNLRAHLKNTQHPQYPTQSIMDTMNTKLAINPVEMPDIVREAILSAEDLMKFVFYQYITEDKAPEQTATSEPIEIEANIFPKYNI